MDDIHITYDEEGTPKVLLKQEPAYLTHDPGFFDDVDLERPFTNQNRAFENADQTLPTIFFFGDSYSVLFDEYVALHFEKTIFIHWVNMNHFEEYIRLYKPDIVVFEVAERELRNLSFSLLEQNDKT